MKIKFLKHFCVYSCALMVFLSAVCFSSFSASAAEVAGEVSYELMPMYNVSYTNVRMLDGSVSENYSCISALWSGVSEFETLQIPEGRYVVLHSGDDYTWPFGGVSGDPSVTPAQVVLLNYPERYISFGEVFEFDPLNDFLIFAQCPNENVVPQLYRVVETDPPVPLYQSASDLFVRFIYGENVELTPEQNLVLTLLSTLLVLAVVLVPFAIVWIVVVKIFNWW